MDGAKKVAGRLASITVPVTDPRDEADHGHCVNCGHWDLLNRNKLCADPECRRSRAQRALEQGAGVRIEGSTYIIADKLRDAPPARLPEKHRVSNTQRQRELAKLSKLTPREINKLRRQGKISLDTARQIQALLVAEDEVPKCKECDDCPRPGDTLCIKHRLEANALQNKLNPPRYRSQESAKRGK